MKDFLESIGGLTAMQIEQFVSFGRKRILEPNTLVFQGNRPFLKLLFIEDGLMRAYRIIDGDDYSYFFFSNNDFAIDFQSFLTETPSPLLLETLSKTRYLEFKKSDVYRLYDRNPKFQKLGRLMAERAYLSAAERLKQYQTDSLKSRYLSLIAKNPKLFQEVPLRFIASYLGVKPQSLSRIRAEISGKHY